MAHAMVEQVMASGADAPREQVFSTVQLMEGESVGAPPNAGAGKKVRR